MNVLDYRELRIEFIKRKKIIDRLDTAKRVAAALNKAKNKTEKRQ